MSKSTSLRFIKAKNDQELSDMVSRLPFKVEYKEIKESKKGLTFWFTLLDEHSGVTNEIIKKAVNGR